MIVRKHNGWFMSILTVLASLAGGCTSGDWNTFQQGTYKGRNYVLQSRSRSGIFSVTNSLDWRFKLGKLPYVPINANTFDWGPVYTTDIFGTDAFEYITGKDTAYSNLQDTADSTINTFLYFAPNKFSEEEYENYAGFMREEWPNLKNLPYDKFRGFPHIIGIVYGPHEKYRQEFNGLQGSEKMVLRIENDGRVRLFGGGTTQSENYSGLSVKVQMPGKILYLDTVKINGGLTMDELQHFKNEQDVPVNKLFNIVPGPNR